MRMMCVYANADFVDKKFDVTQRTRRSRDQTTQTVSWRSKAWEDRKEELREVNPFINLPYVYNETTGEVVTISHAVYLYIGKLYDINGLTDTEQVENEQILSEATNMANNLTDMVYPFRLNKSEEDFRNALDAFMRVSIHERYSRLEAWLEDRKERTFFVAARPCTSDFVLWELLDQHEVMAQQYGHTSPLEDQSRLKAFYDRFRKLKKLERYFASEDATLPCFNKMAYCQ